jgi:hypothetical protein
VKRKARERIENAADRMASANRWPGWMTAERIDRVLQLAARTGRAAQLCVLRNGEVVLDDSIGCSREALFLIYSASKPR